MTVPQLKPEFYQQAESSMGVMSPLLDIINRALELQYAEQATGQPLITAEEARKLWVGKAEVLSEYGIWFTVNQDCPYRETWRGEVIKYRTIKPEPVQQEDVEIRVGDTVRMGVYVCGEFKPMGLAIVVQNVDAQLCRVDKMSLHGGAPWVTLEQKSHLRKEPKTQPEPVEQWQENDNSRGCDKLAEKKYPELLIPTCQVRNLDTGELKTMTREAAKKLQAELGDTVKWWLGSTDMSEWVTLDFNSTELYTYKLKQPKLMPLDWKDVPVGVAVVAVDSDGENACLGQIRYASSSYCVVERASNLAGCNAVSYDVNLLELAPASEQPWIAVQDDRSVFGLSHQFDVVGLTYEFDLMRFRITGLSKGYGYPEQKGGC